MSAAPGEIVIDDSTPMDHPGIDGDGHGLIPRDYSAYPVGYACPAMASLPIPLIPRSEWSDRIKEMEATKSRLSDILRRAEYGRPFKPYYQNGFGYCWAYSTGHAVTVTRAAMHLPFVRLSPFAVAHIIKRGANEGGWSALSMAWVQQNGIPSQDVWPNLKKGLSQDTPAMREDAAKYKITDAWADLDASVYNRKLTFDQMMTLLLNRIPVCADFNWWRHAVCVVDPVEIERGSFGPRILNSHGEELESQFRVLAGSRGIPDGAVAPLAALAA